MPKNLRVSRTSEWHNMKFLEEVQFSENDFGIQIVVRLVKGWKESAAKFPRERLGDILKPSIAFAQKCVQELKQVVEVSGGEYGLHHISLTPERAGLDLFPDQNSYISHNLRRNQAMGVLPVILDYLRLLEHVR